MANEIQKYDAKIDRDDPGKMSYIQKYFLGKGMFYASAISYYYMPLEGFINLVYHSFLKTELDFKDFEKRLDIDLKILLMPALCKGFKGDFIDVKKGVKIIQKELTNYRNHIFHSKLSDSLMNVTLIESGFIYVCQVDRKYKKNEIFQFPHRKIDLTKIDVQFIKNIVKYLIDEILNKMDNKSKKLVEDYFFTKDFLPFWKNEKGIVNFGAIDGTEPEGACFSS